MGWEEERVGEHRVATRADGLRRGVVGRSRGVARGGEVRPGCACGPTGRGRACVRRGGVGAARHRSGPGKTPRGGGLSPIRSADRPRQPLWGGDRGGRGAGPGRHPVRGPGRTPLLGSVARRAGTPRHTTRGLFGGRGSHSWKGRGPSAVDSTPPGAAPQNVDPGQRGNDLFRSRGSPSRSGAGHFPCGIPSPNTTCLNFSL